MLELMLAGNNKTIIPESGPGNKQLLAGDRVDGWFGIVPGAQMPSPAAIVSGTGLSATMPQVANVPLNWLKAVLDGKYVFFPSTPFNTLTLTALYNAGIVYGTDDNGTQIPTGSTATNQFKLIKFVDQENKTWLFKLRLITTINPNTMTSNNIPPTANVTAGEMYKLFSHVTASPTVAPADGVKWDKLTPGRDFYNDRWHSRSIFGSNNYQGAPTYTASQYIWIGNGTSLSWMPTLELINPDEELIPAFDVTGTSPTLTPMNPVLSSTIGTLSPPLADMVGGTELQPWVSSGSLPEPLTPSAINVANSSELPAQMTN